MVSEFNMETKWDALSAAARLTSSLLQELNDLGIRRSFRPLMENIDSLIPSLVISIPHNILDPLHTICVPEITRKALLNRMDRFIADLQEEYNLKYRHTCVEIIRKTNSSDNIDAIHRTYQSLSQKNIVPSIQSQVQFIINEVAKYQTPSVESKRPFNNEFTPVLELYFEHNGYPSPLHRSILAQESGMTVRQIEVWFQNHRKRARQDNKIVRRLESDLPLKRALGGLNRRTHSYPILLPTSSYGYADCQKASDIQTSQLTSVLEETFTSSQMRPPHAFPATRKSQNYDPFPFADGISRFPPPVWRRKPATTPIIPIEVDMDDLAILFHMKLNFINATLKRECTPLQSDPPPFKPWFAPSRTIPPPAPLPALQRRALASESTSILSSIAMDPSTFEFNSKPRDSEASRISCVVRLPFGPQQSASSITERIDRSAEALDREHKSFRMLRRVPRHSPSRLASPGDIAGRKGSSTSRRTPNSLQTFGSRTSSFSSDISSSSDDSSSPPTPAPLPDHELFSDLFVESEDNTVNYDNYFDFSPSQPFDFTFTKPTEDAQSSTLFQNHPLIFT